MTCILTQQQHTMSHTTSHKQTIPLTYDCLHSSDIPNPENKMICNYPRFVPQNDIIQPTHQLEMGIFDGQGVKNNNQIKNSIPVCATTRNYWGDSYNAYPRPRPNPQLIDVMPCFALNQSNSSQNIDYTHAKRATTISPKPQNVQNYYKGSFTKDVSKIPIQSRKKSRKISFSNQVRVRKYNSQDKNEAVKKVLWYSDREMEDFKKSAKEVIYRIRENRCGKDECRGLEARMSEKRSMFRSIAIKTVLKCQGHLFEKRRKMEKEIESERSEVPHNDENLLCNNHQIESDDHLILANVSRKCTKWAQNVAVNAAKSDYYEAYGNNANCCSR